MSTESIAAPRIVRTLRWWPALCLVALIVVLSMLPKFAEGLSLPLLMLSFMGPALVSLFILLWWVFASRATAVEKLIGGTFVFAGSVLTVLFAHPSMQGMGFVINVLPTCGLAFAIPLILFAAAPNVRLPLALVVTGMTFGFWNLVQNDGVDGSFQASFFWRWSPNAEERYLAYLPTQRSAAADLPKIDESPITLVSSPWSSFRGPQRDGRVPGLALKDDWTSYPPEQIWRTPIGPGWSSFTVAKDRLFTQEQRGDQEAVVCMHTDTGKTLWAYAYPSRFWEAVAGSGPRATPTIADEGLFCLGADGVLLCLNPLNGEVKWQRELRKDADRDPPAWGFSASPLVTNGIVIVHAGGKDDKGVLAYYAADGEPSWSAPSGDHSYSSPQLATFDSVTGILMETNTGLQFLNPENGQTIWEHLWLVNNYRDLQPLVVGNSVLIASSLGLGTRRLTVERNESQSGGESYRGIGQGNDSPGKTDEGDSPKSPSTTEEWTIVEDWTSKEIKPDFNDFVEHEGYLYGFDGSILACTDFNTGKRKWKKGRYGNGQVVLLPDGDQLLVISEKGDLVLLSTNPEELTELARLHVIDGKTWNHPVIVGSRIYLRNGEQAGCYSLPRK